MVHSSAIEKISCTSCLTSTGMLLVVHVVENVRENIGAVNYLKGLSLEPSIQCAPTDSRTT